VPQIDDLVALVDNTRNGPGDVYICDECVDLCNDIIFSEGGLGYSARISTTSGDTIPAPPPAWASARAVSSVLRRGPALSIRNRTRPLSWMQRGLATRRSRFVKSSGQASARRVESASVRSA
jgi:ClpX C4-type zinc finger